MNMSDLKFRCIDRNTQKFVILLKLFLKNMLSFKYLLIFFRLLNFSQRYQNILKKLLNLVKKKRTRNFLSCIWSIDTTFYCCDSKVIPEFVITDASFWMFSTLFIIIKVLRSFYFQYFFFTCQKEKLNNIFDILLIILT